MITPSQHEILQSRPFNIVKNFQFIGGTQTYASSRTTKTATMHSIRSVKVTGSSELHEDIMQSVWKFVDFFIIIT